MGHKRQLRRVAEHKSGSLDEKRLAAENCRVRIPFNVRIYFRNGASSVEKVWIGGTTTAAERIAGFVSQKEANRRADEQRASRMQTSDHTKGKS